MQKSQDTLLILGLSIIVLIAIFFLYPLLSPKPQPVLGDVHKHADFKVYLDGLGYNFTQEKYMSSNSSKLSNFVHLHDMDGGIIHQHMTTITLGTFFRSLNMTFNSSCFVPDNGTFCNSGEKTLKMFVQHSGGQWERNSKMGDYEFIDLDRILISYGSENDAQLAKQMESVTDRACIPSEKCPERGHPPDENSSCNTSGPCVA